MKMKSREKVVPYVAKGSERKERVNDTRFGIRNTKQEEAFLPFSQPNSALSQLCFMTSEDPLLRLFFFLKPSISYIPVEEYPLVLGYPFFVDFNEDFLNSVSKEPIKTKVEDTKKKRDESTKTVRDLTSRVMWRFFSFVVRDKQVSDRLKRRRLRLKEEEMDDLFSGLVKRRKKQFGTMTKDFTDIYGSMYYSKEYYEPLIQAFEMVEEAKENLAVLSTLPDLEDLGKALSNSLSKLIGRRIFRIITHSFCMECTLKKGFEPYSMTVKYPSEAVFESECKKCNGKTIFHVVAIEAPYTFGPLLKENRLPEFIIGFTLATSKKIKKIYIHKKVQEITRKGPLAGQQLNIFAITKDDKILIIEVTTSKDLNKILEAVYKKQKALKDFPYDGLVFITPSLVIQEYPRLNKVRIFGARHLPRIVSHMKHFLGEISKT